MSKKVCTLFITVLCGITISSCSSTGPTKVVLDSSPERPDWVKGNKIIWEDSGNTYLRSTHTVNGSERINGCYDLAKLDSKENLLSEIANDVRGRLDNAQQSISENAEVLLGKVRSGEFEGKITGLRHLETYYERYRIGETERLDCQVLSEISRANYNTTKQAVLNKLIAIDQRIKEAITKKQVEFFSDSPAAQKTPERETASPGGQSH